MARFACRVVLALFGTIPIRYRVRASPMKLQPSRAWRNCGASCRRQADAACQRSTQTRHDNVRHNSCHVWYPLTVVLPCRRASTTSRWSSLCQQITPSWRQCVWSSRRLRWSSADQRADTACIQRQAQARAGAWRLASRGCQSTRASLTSSSTCASCSASIRPSNLATLRSRSPRRRRILQMTAQQAATRRNPQAILRTHRTRLGVPVRAAEQRVESSIHP